MCEGPEELAERHPALGEDGADLLVLRDERHLRAELIAKAES